MKKADMNIMSMDAINTATSTATVLPSSVAASTPPISSTASSPSPTPSSAPVLPPDQVTISPQGDRASKMIQQARLTFSDKFTSTEVNSSQSEQLKQDVANGQYPPQALTEGLLSLIGSSLVSAAESNGN